jgi:hypothetical protein
MKRDRDYLRALLIEFEDSQDGTVLLGLAKLNPSDDERKKFHHVKLLVDEGLIKQDGEYMFRITALGHDAAEAIREPQRWKSLRESAPKKAYEILEGVSSSLAVAALSRLFGWN